MGAYDNVLNDIKAADPENAQVGVEDVNKYTPPDFTPEMSDAYAEYQKSNTPATGALSENAYYPGGVNRPTGVGTYSGSLIGSTTLFAPGAGVVPLGMLDARDAAVQKAAYKKQKDVSDFRDKFKAPTSKLTNINEKLTSQYFGFVDDSWKEAMKKSGGDASKATFLLKNDPAFKAKEKSYQDYAKHGDAIVNKVAQDEQEIKSGKFTPTGSYNEAKKKLYTALDPSNEEFKNLGSLFNQMQIERDFSDSFNDVTKKMVASQTGYAGADLNDPEFAKIYEGTVKSWSPEQKAAVAKTLTENIYAGSDYFTPEKIKKDVDGLLSGVQKESKLNLKAKRAPEGGADYQYNENDISKEPASTNAFTSRGQGNAPGTGEIVSDYGVSHKKPIKAIIPTGRTLFINDEQNGMIKSNEVNPNADVQLQKTKLIKVLSSTTKNDGTPLTEEQLKDGKLKYRWQPMTEMTITEGTGEDKVQKTAYIPAKEVENYLVKKKNTKTGAVEMGIPVDKFEAEAAKRNAELGGGGKKTEDLRKKYNY